MYGKIPERWRRCVLSSYRLQIPGAAPLPGLFATFTFDLSPVLEECSTRVPVYFLFSYLGFEIIFSLTMTQYLADKLK